MTPYTHDEIMEMLAVRRGRHDWIPFSREETLRLIAHYYRDAEEISRLKAALDMARIKLRQRQKALF